MSRRFYPIQPLHDTRPVPQPRRSSEVDTTLPDPSRRDFLRIAGASLALASAGCSGPPPEGILPYVQMPEQTLPGQPTFYATTLVRNGYGLGVLVESNMGRPTKVEGNPRHPASRGSSDTFAQAEVLRFWDPERSKSPMHGAQPLSWQAVSGELAARAAALQGDGGAGLRVLTGTMTSSAWLAQWQSLQRRFPAAQWHCHDPMHDTDATLAAELAFGAPLDNVCHFDRAALIVSFDADFLSQGAGAVAYARDYAAQRRDPSRPARLYCVESLYSLTGANADQRLALPPEKIELLIWRLAAALGMPDAQVSAADVGLTTQGADANTYTAWEKSLATMLSTHRGNSLLLAGPTLSPQTRALVLRLNHFLGNTGRTLDFIEPVAPNTQTQLQTQSQPKSQPQSQPQSMAALVADMHAGRVDTLLIIDANPVYTAAADLDFATALTRVPHTIHAGLYRDETAERCGMHLPLAHTFEYWGDARAYDGTHSVIQPLIRPLYDGRSPRAVLALLDNTTGDDLTAVRRALRMTSDQEWARVLREGAIAAPPSASRKVYQPPSPLSRQSKLSPPQPSATDATALSAIFVADTSTDTGEYANNAWLQELPRPLTRLVWDNAATVAPALAARHRLSNGDIVEIKADGRVLHAPIWIQPGQADNTVGLPLGYGRWGAGSVGNGVGFNAYAIKGHDRVSTVSLTATGERHELVCVQPGMSMEGRPLARHVQLDELNDKAHGDVHGKPAAAPPPRDTLYPPYAYPDYAWGMSVDLNACIGCGACTVACQAENNIPVVGKTEAARGRAMHWIRVDRYYEDRNMLFQPVPCMHCEDAPCEPVCPVGATMHDSEGINVQVYNRCVGTRYCSNNCPYKVRRFNFLQYANTDIESFKAGRNPEVTVRSRGVMEKCNYCLQRITRARIAAEEEGRRIADGEVVTACQAVCPTRAIVFGDLNDPHSQVNAAKSSPLDYAMLSELNTRPRTSYRMRVLAGPDVDEEQESDRGAA